MNTILRLIKVWLQAARAPFFTGSLAPIMVGTALAFYDRGAINWLNAVLALISLTLLHASANMANDFFDHLSGNDAANRTFAAPFTGGSRVIQSGLLPAWQVIVASVLSMGAGALIGFYLVWVAGWPILWLGLIGGLSGFFYTAPPFRFVYRGLGELFIFIDFGLLPVVGAYYLQTQTFTPAAFLAGVPVGLLIMNVLWINQFQDREADAQAGKRHWVVRLGTARSAVIHAAVMAATYVSIMVGIALSLFPATAFLALIAAPVAAIASVVALRHHNDLPRLTPANAATIGSHLLTSLLLSLGFVIARLAA